MTSPWADNLETTSKASLLSPSSLKHHQSKISAVLKIAGLSFLSYMVYTLLQIEPEDLPAQRVVLLARSAQTASKNFQLAIDAVEEAEANVQACSQEIKAKSLTMDALSESSGEAERAGIQAELDALNAKMKGFEQRQQEAEGQISQFGRERHNTFYMIYEELQANDKIVPAFIREGGCRVVLNELDLTTNDWLQTCLMGVLILCCEQQAHRDLLAAQLLNIVPSVVETLKSWKQRFPNNTRISPPASCARLFNCLLRGLPADAPALEQFEREGGVRLVLDDMEQRVKRCKENNQEVEIDLRYLLQFVATLAVLACDRPSLFAGLQSSDHALLSKAISACLESDVTAQEVESTKNQSMKLRRIRQLVRAFNAHVPAADNAQLYRRLSDYMAAKGLQAEAADMLRALCQVQQQQARQQKQKPSTQAQNEMAGNRLQLAALLTSLGSDESHNEALALLSDLRDELEDRDFLTKDPECRVQLLTVLDSLGRLYRRLGKSDDAIEAFRKAMRLDPQTFQRYLEIAELLLSARPSTTSAESALQTLQTAENLRPNDYQCQLLKGRAYSITGATEHAVQAFRAAIQAEPKKRGAYSKLASLLLSLGRYEEAAHVCEDAFFANSSNWPALMFLARIQREQETNPLPTYLRVVSVWKQRPEILDEEEAARTAHQIISDFARSNGPAAVQLHEQLDLLDQKKNIGFPDFTTKQ